MHYKKVTASICAIFLCAPFVVSAMELMPEDVLEYNILKRAIVTIDEMAAAKPDLPDLFCVPHTLKKACTLRLVSKKWRSLLTIPKILEYAEIDETDLAQWQCYYAVNQNDVLQKLRSQQSDLKDKKNREMDESFECAVKDVTNRSFVTMSVLLRRRIVKPDIRIPMKADRFFSAASPDLIIQMPLLQYALYFNAHYKFIELLVHAGADVNYDLGLHIFRTPLYTQAVHYRDTSNGDTIKKCILLLAAGACSYSVYKGDSLLDSIARNHLLNDNKKKMDAGTNVRILGNDTENLSFLLVAPIKIAHQAFSWAIEKERKRYVEAHARYEEDTKKYVSNLSDENK